jgi:hypothetical protein
MPAAPLFALRLGVSLVMGFGALHALLARQSLVIASLELLGAAILLLHTRLGAAMLSASLIAAATSHRELPVHFVIPALALAVVASARSGDARDA